MGMFIFARPAAVAAGLRDVDPRRADDEFNLDLLRHAILPVTALTIAADRRLHALRPRRHPRRASGDYVTTARAKGLRERLVLWRPRLPQRPPAAGDDRRAGAART